jgi:hypothetical protein
VLDSGWGLVVDTPYLRILVALAGP